MQTEVHSPAKTSRFLPIWLTRSVTRPSSQVFMLVRSITSAPGKASLISSKIGPEKVFSATVVRMVETLKPAAAAATIAALLRSVTVPVRGSDPPPRQTRYRADRGTRSGQLDAGRPRDRPFGTHDPRSGSAPGSACSGFRPG